MRSEQAGVAVSRAGVEAAAVVVAVAPAAVGAAAWRVAAAAGWALGCGALVASMLRLPGGAWWAMAAYHVGCVAATAILGSRGSAARVVGARPGAGVLAGVAIASCAVVIVAGAIAAPQIDWSPAARLWRTWGLEPPRDWLWLLYYASVNPWVEERFWRGALLGDAVRSRLGTRGARILTIAAFLTHHAVVLLPSFGAARGLLLCVPILAAGALWVWLHERSGRLSWCIASHAGADAGLVILYLLGPRA